MTIAGNDKLTALKHLANDRTPAFVATAIGAAEADVEQLLDEYGPDKERLRWCIEELERQEAAAARASIPRAEHRATAPTNPRRVAATPAPRPVHVTEPAEPGTIDALLARADKIAEFSGTARVRRAAKKVRDAATALEEALAGVEERKRAAAREAAAKAKARAEVERLERELAEAKARLKGSTPATTKAKSATSSTTSAAARIRAWARDNGITCPAVGRVPAAVREQYEQAHTGSAA